MRTLTALESSVVGAISGMIEVFLQQPSVSIKNAVQDKQPIIWNPRILYRGVIVNAASMAPISAIQFGVNTALENRMTGNLRSLTSIDKTGIGLAAGAVSAVVSNPSEVIMIQQQRTGLSILSQVQYLYHHHGWLSLGRGFIPCLVREAIYTATYLSINPALHTEIMKVDSGSAMKFNPTWALVLASCISGTAATVLTQPIDTIKTRMQANMDVLKYRKLRSATQTIVEEGGYRALYSGLIPRTQRIVCAVLILSEAKHHLTHLYLNYLEKQG